MGDWADSIIEGECCQVCGEPNEGEPIGHAYTCPGCSGDGEDGYKAIRRERLAEMTKRVHGAIEWAKSVGLKLTVSNNNTHWEFRRTGFICEWWPSTGKLVFDKDFHRAQRTYDRDHVKREIERRIAKIK